MVSDNERGAPRRRKKFTSSAAGDQADKERAAGACRSDARERARRACIAASCCVERVIASCSVLRARESQRRQAQLQLHSVLKSERPKGDVARAPRTRLSRRAGADIGREGRWTRSTRKIGSNRTRYGRETGRAGTRGTARGPARLDVAAAAKRPARAESSRPHGILFEFGQLRLQGFVLLNHFVTN